MAKSATKSKPARATKPRPAAKAASATKGARVTKPAKAAKSAKPARAAKTARTAKPAARRPTKPARGAKPAASRTPAKSARTSRPAKPAASRKPAKPARATRPAASRKPAKPAAASSAAKPARTVKTTKPAGAASARRPAAAAEVQKPASAVKIQKPARVKKAKLAFAAGDYVVYPTHGVGKVVDVVTEKIAGFELQLFVINFAAEKMTLRVPVEKAEESGLRKISSKDKMLTAISTLRGRARAKRTMWSRRAQEYEAKINSGDPVSIAEVVRDLHRSPDQPDQSYSERQMYEAALNRLAHELALVEKIESDAATERLETLLLKAA